MNITKELLIKLLAESPSFREFAAEQLHSVNRDIRSEVLGYLKVNNKLKIQCIKHLRTNYNVSEIVSAFPDYSGSFDGYSIGLKDAKDFVEHYLKTV